MRYSLLEGDEPLRRHAAGIATATTFTRCTCTARTASRWPGGFPPPPHARSSVPAVGRRCSQYPVQAAHSPSAQAHQCYAKCGPGSACHGEPFAGNCAVCSGYMPEYDTEDSDALCIGKDDCFALCNESPNCLAVEFATDELNHKRCARKPRPGSGAQRSLGRCYLNHFGCKQAELTGTLVTDANWEIWFVRYENTETCPLGSPFRLRLAALCPGAGRSARQHGAPSGSGPSGSAACAATS